MFLTHFLISLSLIFELGALILSFYFKNAKIFFLTLSLLGIRMAYLYASIFQANLFISLFSPMIFTLFCLKNYSNSFLKNISCIIVLIFISILSIILPKSTTFNSASLDFHFITFTFFNPVSGLGFLFFLSGTFLILIKTLKCKEYYLLVAFLGAYLQFLFQKGGGIRYFELASLIFCFHLLNYAYKLAFFDTLTKLPNEKNLLLFIKGKSNYIIALLHFNGLEKPRQNYVKLILKQIAKILKRFKIKIFIIENNFVLIFKDKNEALNQLAFLESTLKNTELSLENEKFKPNFNLVWQEDKGGLEQNLQDLRAKLLS